MSEDEKENEESFEPEVSEGGDGNNFGFSGFGSVSIESAIRILKERYGDAEISESEEKRKAFESMMELSEDLLKFSTGVVVGAIEKVSSDYSKLAKDSMDELAETMRAQSIISVASAKEGRFFKGSIFGAVVGAGFASIITATLFMGGYVERFATGEIDHERNIRRFESSVKAMEGMKEFSEIERGSLKESKDSILINGNGEAGNRVFGFDEDSGQSPFYSTESFEVRSLERVFPRKGNRCLTFDKATDIPVIVACEKEDG